MPISIVYFIDMLYNFAGTERHLFELLGGLDRRRFRPLAFAFKGREGFTRKIEQLGVPVRILNMSRIYGLKEFATLFSLRALLRKENVRIMQTFHTNPDIFGTVLAKLSGVPIIVSSRRDMGIDRTKKTLQCYRFLNRYVDHIICVSGKVREYTLAEEKVPADKISVIHNGIETGKLDRAVDVEREKEKLGLAPRAPVIGVLANFNPVKGHRFFIEAGALIKGEAPGAQFLLAGIGALRPALEQKARDLGIKRSTHFIGHREDIAEVLSVMDILVAPSLSEGFSNTILEALYMKKPVVATDVGGNAEVIQHEETGLLVPAGDPSAIAGAVLRLLKDPSLARRLAENGRKLIEQKFLFKDMLASTVNIYERLISEKHLHDRETVDGSW